MEIRQALGVLENLVNERKALEQLVGVLEVAARLEEQVGQLETAKVNLAAEVEALKASRDREAEALRNYEVECDANYHRVREKTDAKIAELHASFKVEQETAKETMSTLTKKIDQLREKHVDIKKKMDEDIAERQTKLDDLNSVIEQARTRLKAIG